MTKHHLERALEINDRFRCGLLDPSVIAGFLDGSAHLQSQHNSLSLTRKVCNVSVHAGTHTSFLSHPWGRFMKKLFLAVVLVIVLLVLLAVLALVTG